MKKKKVIIGIAAAALAAAAITTAVVLSGDKIKTIPIDEAAEELKDYQFKTYDNLKFECDPRPLDAENLYVIQIKVPDEYEDEDDKNWHIDYLFNKENELFGYDIGRDDIEEESRTELTCFIQDGASCTIYPSHTFLFSDGKREDPLLRASASLGDETDMSTYTDLAKQAHAKINVDGKEVDLTKAAEYAKQSFESNFSDIMNDGEEIRVKDAIAVRREDGEIGFFVIRMQHMIEGLAVNENGYFDPRLGAAYIRPPVMRANMTAEDEIVGYYNSFYYNTVDKKKIKKIISLTTATDILSNTLAQNLKYTVRDVELKYTAVVNGKLIENKNKDKDIIEMRPMWSFVLNYSPANYMQFVNSTTAYVDAITGVTYYCSYDNFEESEPIL